MVKMMVNAFQTVHALDAHSSSRSITLMAVLVRSHEFSMFVCVSLPACVHMTLAAFHLGGFGRRNIVKSMPRRLSEDDKTFRTSSWTRKTKLM